MTRILSRASFLYQTIFRKNAIFRPTTKLTLARNYMPLNNRMDESMQQRFRLKDKVDNVSYQLIYREGNSLVGIVSIMYHAGWIGTAVGLSIIAYLFYDIFRTPGEHPHKVSSQFANTRSLSKLNMFDLICVAMLGAASIVVVSRLIPFRIYHSPTEKLYKAVFVKSIWTRRQVVTFGEGTAVPVFKNKNLGHLLFYINDHTILLDEDSFPIPAHREKMIRGSQEIL